MAAATTTKERLIVPAGQDSGPVAPFPLRVCGPVIKGFGRGSKELNIPTANIPVEGLSVGGCERVESGVYFGWASLDLDSLPMMNSNISCGLPNDIALGDGTAVTTAVNSQRERRNGDNIVKNVANEAPGKANAADVDASARSGVVAEDGHHRRRQAHIFPMVMSIGWNPFYKNTVRSVEVHIIHKFSFDFYGAQMSLVILGYIRPELDYVSKEALIEDINTDIEIAKISLERDAYKKYKFDEYLL